MSPTSSRKRPNLRAKVTHEVVDNARTDATNVRRSTRILGLARRNLESTTEQRDSSQQPRSSQPARRGNKNTGKPRRGGTVASSRSLRAEGTTARVSFAESKQTGSGKRIKEANTATKPSSKSEGQGQDQEQQTSLRRNPSRRTAAAAKSTRQEAQETSLPQPTVSRKKSSRGKTKAVEVSTQPTSDIDLVQQEQPPTERQISTWTRQIVSPSPERAGEDQALYLARGLEFPLDEPVGMESNTTSSTRDDESTVKGRKGESLKVSPAKLRYRRVYREVRRDRPDPKMAELGKILEMRLPERTIGAVPQFPLLLTRFLERADENKEESCYPFIDDLSYQLDREKFGIRFPIITAQYFEANLKRCLSMNEAVLQRTIMMTVFDQHWLGETFDWNTEGQWFQPKDSRVPSTIDDKMSSPKPDLAISFSRRSFTGFDISDPIPAELEKCISPEGDDRCFPFLFMEVKKAASDLQDAYLANLNNASQALFNMYLWMAQAGQMKEFFDEIRVFSLVFNAEDMSVRVHRCAQESDGELFFFFDEVRAPARYNRDQAWVLVNSILENYAAEKLHPTLKNAYETVSRQEKERVASKRKAKKTQNTTSKRVRGSTSGELNQNTSFGISALST